MLTVSTFLGVYVLGGITFIPLILIVILCHAYFALPAHDGNATSDGRERVRDDNWQTDPAELTNSELKSLPEELTPRNHEPDVAAGYFAVCREYVPGGINGRPPERITPAGAVVTTESSSVYQSMYRSIFDRNKSTTPTLDGANGKTKKARNLFYVVLRHGHLMLYDDSEQLEVRHVISLAPYDVDIYAGGDDIPEGELWIKRNCIRLRSKSSLENTEAAVKSFFLFSDNSSEKEDFYFAMLQNQEHTTGSSHSAPRPLQFETEHLVKLVQQLHASEENIQTRWLNALLGRLFLGLYKTSEVEDFLRTKITKKIARVSKPAFITDIKLQRMDLGDLPPFITNPKLKELTVDGDLTVEADVKYKGNFRIELSAIARIDLGPRFKAREVTLILATILKKLDGHILIRIKPPPSNRLWISFESAPKMDISLEPIVSSRQITYGIILRALENRIREVVNETLVFPSWDDLPWTNTASQQFRGGVWADSSASCNTGDAEAKSQKSLQTSAIEESDYQGECNSASREDIIPRALNAGPSEKPRSMSSLSNLSTADVGLESGSADPTPCDGYETSDLSTEHEVKDPGRPRVMRSSSFASKASPILNMNPANVEATKSRGGSQQHDAASTMKSISRSHPASPVTSPVGSPDRTSHSIKCQHESENDKHASEAPDTGLGSRHATSETLPRQTLGTSPDHRKTLNQSLNSATAAAKRWFGARQTEDSLSRAAEGIASRHRASDPESTVEDTTLTPTAALGHILSNRSLSLSTTPEVSGPALGSPAFPIGRGRPLPPPGTPLPLPPKLEKRGTGWGVPSASAIANLAKRKPFAGKQKGQMGVPEELSSSSSTSNSNTSLADGGELRHPMKKVSKSIGGRPSSASSGAPAVPRRRQRHSVSDVATANSEDNEGLLVVEAPILDTPSTHMHGIVHEATEEQEHRPIPPAISSGADSDDSVFLEMEIDQN
jgi:hypothetical protein